MENRIIEIISQTVEETGPEENTRWRAPLTAFASADDPMMSELQRWVDPKHLLPADLLPDAQTVICYYIPFKEDISKSNRGGRIASRPWVDAYVETNRLIESINSKIADALSAEGYACKTTPATHNFDPKELISYWSHRHLAYISGLGTFGLNNMLITKKGSSGRFGSCVTNLKLTSGKRTGTENCLFKSKGTCGVCVKKCVNGALAFDGFDRFKCYEICLENDAEHETGTLTDVCGKCIAGMPCSNKNPAG